MKVNAVSKQDNDAAQAQMKTARAAMKTAKTNLDYTKVESPISGRVGRSEVTPGALANAYQTFMTTVQQLDPIYVDVRQTSSDMLRLKHEIASGKIKAKDGAVEVTVLMEDGSVYPQKGKLTFTGEEVDEGTGMLICVRLCPILTEIFCPVCSCVLVLKKVHVRIRSLFLNAV